MMCIFALTVGSVGTGTPGCALGGGPGGHGLGGEFGGDTKGAPSPRGPRGPAGGARMSKNSTADDRNPAPAGNPPAPAGRRGYPPEPGRRPAARLGWTE